MEYSSNNLAFEALNVKQDILTHSVQSNNCRVNLKAFTDRRNKKNSKYEITTM